MELLGLGVSNEPDYPALAVFLRLGFYLAEDTPFRAIRALPPGGRILWRDGRTTVRACYPKTGASGTPSRTTAINRYIEAFRASVAARADSLTAVVPLSGGRDSRHILYELQHNGTPRICAVTTRHFPPRSNEDEVVAKTVAEATGTRHYVIDAPKNRFELELQKNRLTGFASDEHAWALAAGKEIARHGQTAFDGIAGDVLSNSLFLTKEALTAIRSGEYAALFPGIFTTKADELWRRCLPRTVYGKVSWDVAATRLKTEIERHSHAPNPVASFYFWNRTRREVALCPLAVYPKELGLRFPFLDEGVFDLLMSLPAEYFLTGAFHDEAIHRAFPQYDHLRFDKRSSERVADGATRRRFRRSLLLYLTRVPRRCPVNLSFVLPRLLSGVVQRNDNHSWLNETLLLYLAQLSVDAGMPFTDSDPVTPQVTTR